MSNVASYSHHPAAVDNLERNLKDRKNESECTTIFPYPVYVKQIGIIYVDASFEATYNMIVY